MEEENNIPPNATSSLPIDLDVGAQLFSDPEIARSDDDEKRDEKLTEEVNIFGTGNIAIDEILFPVNPSLASIVKDDEIASQNLDEEGNPMIGGTDTSTGNQGEDVQNSQLAMGNTEYFSTKDDEYVDFRAEQFTETEKILNTITNEIKIFDRSQTLEGITNQIPVLHPDYIQIKKEYEDFNQQSIDATGVGLGKYSTQDTSEAEELLQNISNDAGILNFDSINNLNVPLNVNEDGYFNPDGELPKINWDATETEVKESKDNKYDWEKLKNLTQEEIDNIQITSGFEAFAISKMLEGQPAGSNMRDIFQQEGMEDYETFMTWAGSQFKKIKMSDPVLAGWQRIIKAKVDEEYFSTKRLEFEEKFIKPCQEKNDGVATEDCLLQHQEEASAWYNDRYNKLYTQNEYVNSSERQYAIGFSKLMNKLREPFYRTKIDIYRELDDQFERDGYDFTTLGRDALARVGFSTDQTKALINVMYLNTGVTGTTARNQLMEDYNSPGFQEFAEESGIYDQAIETFRGGGGAETGFGKGGYLQGNLLNLDTAFNIVDGKITKSTLGSADEGDFYYPAKVPGGIEYVLHGGSGNLADREGTVEITEANFRDYFDVPDDFNVYDLNKVGARAAWEMVKQHGKAYYSPIKAQEFSRAKKVVNGIDKWVVAGKAKNWFNQTAIARMYGGTGWKYGDLTIRDVFEGREATEGEKMISSVLNYDVEQTGLLLDQTSKMLEAEAAAGYSLDPDTEFSDLTSFMRHMVGQVDTMGFMYAGGILEGTGKLVSKVPGYGKPIGYGMQGTGKILTVLGSLNMMAKEFTSNVIETWRQAIMKNNGGKPPTVEEFIAMASDPASEEVILKGLAGAAASTGSEKLGVSATMLGFKPGGRILASLYRGQILQFFKQTPKWVLTTALGAGGEGVTEAVQGRIHETTVNWSLGMGLGESWSQSNWDEEGFQVGWRIGLALPVAQSTVSQSLVEINQVGMDVASKLIMDPSKSNSIFAPMASANNFFKESIADIQKRIDNKSIPREEGLNAISNLSTMRNSGMKIPVTMQAEERKQMLELLIAQNNLELSIKKTNNKQISEGNGDIAALELINNQITSLTEQEVTRELYMKNMGNVQKIVDETSKGKVKIFREKNTDAINKRIEELNNSGWKIRKQSKENAGYGDIYQKGDEQVILLNEAEILSDGKINTGAHEFLHAVIYQTVKNSKGTAIELGNNLLTYIKQINPELLKDGQFKERYEQYKNDETVTDAVMGEEILTLFSEAVLDGAIKLDSSMRQQVGDFFTRIIDTLMGRKRSIRFDTGKDVYDFIKGYNKSIKTGKFTQAQTELLEGRAQGDLVKREYRVDPKKKRVVTKSKSSKKLTELTNEYKEGNSENVIDLTQQYQAAGRDALKRWAGKRGVPLNLSNPKVNEEVTSLLNKQFPSFTKNFDSSKAEATTYLDNIAKRIGPDLVKEATRQSTSLDSMKENVGFDVAGESQTDFDAPAQKSTARKKKYATSVPAIKNQISENVTSDLIGGVNKEGQTTGLAKDIVSNIGRNTDPETVAKSIIANTKNKSVMQTMRSLVGKWGTQEYNDFVDKIVNQGLIGTIPSSTIKRRLGRQSNIDSGLIKYKKTGTTDQIKVKDGKKTYSRPGVYEITNLNKEKLKEYYKSSEKRQQSLFSMITESIMAEGVQNLRSDKAFMGKLGDVLEIKKSPLTPSEFMDGLEQKLDQRVKEDTSLDTVTVKASKKYKRSAKIVKPSIKDYMSDRDLGMYAIKGQKFEHDKFTDDQIKARNESILLTIPEFGLDFYEFTNPTSKKTRSSDSFGASSGRTIFNFNAGNNIDQLKDLLNAPLTGAFIEANPEYVKKYTKTIGNDKFLDKDKLKKGSSLSAKDITVLKRAESEQGQYAKLSPEQRIELLRDKKFRDNQAEKSKILKKILNVINKNVRKDGKIIPGRMEFWASWINSQVNNSKHVMRVLAPIEFFSLSKLPKSTFVEHYKVVKGVVVSGNPLNYVAEHLMPANNAAKIAVDLIYNNTVNKDFSLIKDNYVQGQLLKTDDVIVGKAGYTSQFPSEFWQMDKPNVWVRYLLGNPNINLNEYVTYKDGKVMTIAESLGLPLDKSLRNPDSINFQNKLLKEILGVYKENNTFVLKEPKSIKSAKAELKDSQIVNGKSSKKVNVNQKTLFNLITPNSTTEASIEAMGNADKTVELGNKSSKKIKGISVFDFDDTLAFSKSMVIVIAPDGTTTKISPAQFASEAELLEQNGAEFDFTEFEKVVKGRKGPLADLALKRQDKFGSGDIFVLTARPQASAVSIKKFLDGIGLNLPLENITGLANGSPDAKALWVLDKTAKGYNDFYFADDALANVQAVKNILDQVDVKSDVQLAKSSKKQRMNKEFNVIIEQQSGKEWYKTYSDARAKVEGKAVNKFEFFIPPSAEDFTGLLYKILPKGENGNLAKAWIQDNLLDPFNKAEQLVIKAKIAVAQDFQALRESIKNVPKNLSKPSGHSNFTFSQALRVHIWTMQGMDIPGLSTRDRNALNKLIENNPALKVFAEKIAFIQKGKEYPGPNADWVSGSITSDIINGIQKVYRKEALQEWQENVDIIFSKENMNKLEALYGSNFTTALSNMLSRMKRGSNRPVGGNAQVENVMDWLNNSVGAIMFLNVKSGLLQLISSVNFMNWSDNNPFKAGLAFANQKQYWKDVMYLLNSDYLVQRRNGLKINVAESEIAEASKKGGMKGVISYILNKGFLFTRIADSLAISTGGATFYRNRVNSLLKQVNIDTGKTYTKAEAEAKAFNDFYQISEESQQSSRTDRISMQQASGLGRLVLNFANTPMQYARIIKKSTKDLLAGRGDWKTNLSKIFYYGAMQNLIFNAMQAAVFTTLFKEDDDEEKERRGADDKAMAIGQGMLSSLLRGLGYGGALVDTLIAISLEVGEQSKKKTPDFEEAVWSVFDYSPAIDSKIRKLRSAAKTYKYNRKEIYRRGFNLDNPAYLALGQVVSASTNVPADRALRLMMSLKQMSDKDLELWQRAMLAMGYSSWQAELPYWGTKTTLENEEREDAQIKIDYKRENTRLKQKGYKRRPMTKGIPNGKLNVDYIRVVRPTGDYEYWLMPKNK